jgi:4a-hydroxytetrahydrobiopterin dehydratase
MRARRRRAKSSDYLSDALTLLSEWQRDGVQLRRVDGQTQILLGDRDAEAITDGEVTLAARIEDFYRTVVGVD